MHRVVQRLHRLGRAQNDLDIAQRKLVFADHLKQVVGAVKAQLRGQIVQPHGGFALALQQFFHGLAALGYRFRQSLRVEPGAHFGAGALAVQKTQLGVEPVARGPTLFGGNDVHGLAIAQRGAQGH